MHVLQPLLVSCVSFTELNIAVSRHEYSRTRVSFSRLIVTQERGASVEKTELERQENDLALGGNDATVVKKTIGEEAKRL